MIRNFDMKLIHPYYAHMPILRIFIPLYDIIGFVVVVTKIQVGVIAKNT
jgi:hypothetical protein